MTKNTKLTIATAMIYMVMYLLFPAQASWNKSYEVHYVMGDGDNRASARQAALEQIKLKASNEAGTYVQSTSTLTENGELTENVKMIGAAMLKIGRTEEKLSVNEAGQSVLWLKADVALDESELARRVKMLQEDKEKARLVKQLQAENDTYRQALSEIRTALTNKQDPAKTAELLAKQDATIRHIEENGRTVTQVFEHGTLLQLADHNTADFKRAKQVLDEKFYPAITHSVVTAELESVEASGDGYVALVRVGWDINPRIALPILAPYINARGHGANITAFAHDNLNGKGPNILSDRIYHYLAQKGVDMQLRIAGKEVRLPVFYIDDAFTDPCGLYSRARAGGEKYLCLVSQNSRSKDVRGYPVQTSNPIRIDLTREEASRATRVEATLVEVKNGGLRTGKTVGLAK